MELSDLINKPASECSDEELEKQAHLLSRLKIKADPVEGGKPRAARKTNANARVADLLKGMDKETLKALLEKMKGE